VEKTSFFSAHLNRFTGIELDGGLESNYALIGCYRFYMLIDFCWKKPPGGRFLCGKNNEVCLYPSVPKFT
jgi:hypothetical protein